MRICPKLILVVPSQFCFYLQICREIEFFSHVLVLIFPPKLLSWTWTQMLKTSFSSCCENSLNQHLSPSVMFARTDRSQSGFRWLYICDLGLFAFPIFCSSILDIGAEAEEHKQKHFLIISLWHFLCQERWGASPATGRGWGRRPGGSRMRSTPSWSPSASSAPATAAEPAAGGMRSHPHMRR